MTSPSNTRTLIVENADRLFYHAGFDHTSLADIAETVGVSRGNFYYHFKTKNEILDAVIAKRLLAAHAILGNWESQSGDPLDRIKSYFSFFTFNKDKIKNFGCPMGTLTSEMGKLKHGAQKDSLEIYNVFRNWLGHEFERLDFNAQEADELAMHIIMRSQGIAIVFNAFHDETFVETEVRNVFKWLDNLTNEKENTSCL